MEPKLTVELREISTYTLAYIGDAVFELMVRTFLCVSGNQSVEKLHNTSVNFVSAKAQANALQILLPVFYEDEIEIYKRGRNLHTGQTPKSSTAQDYHNSTGLEAVFGYLYLSCNIKRLNELFDLVIRKD